MDFSIDMETRAQLEAFESFCQTEILPFSKAVDQRSEVPLNHIKKLVKIGYYETFFNKENGGLGLPWLQRVFLQESLAKVCGSTYLSVGASLGLFGSVIETLGTAAQRENIIPGLLNGELTGCLALTESSGGSNLKNTTTKIEDLGDHYLLNGEKVLITNSTTADFAAVLATHSGDEEKFSLLLVNLNDSEGVSRSEAYQTMGV